MAYFIHHFVSVLHLQCSFLIITSMLKVGSLHEVAMGTIAIVSMRLHSCFIFAVLCFLCRAGCSI